MIHIEQNQIIPENPNLRVLSVTGDYNDNDLIECYPLDNPSFALCAFTSSFIKYGNIVNQYTDPLSLGEALLAVDPTCTHDAAVLFKEEEIRRIKREGGDFSPENPVPVDETISKVAQDEAQQQIEENINTPQGTQVEEPTITTPVDTTVTQPTVEQPIETPETPVDTSITPEIIQPEITPETPGTVIPIEIIPEAPPVVDPTVSVIKRIRRRI